MTFPESLLKHSKQFFYLYACPTIQQDAIWYKGSKQNFFSISLRFAGPLLLSMILLTNLWYELHATGPAVIIRWGWFFIALIASGWLATRAPQAAKAAH